MKNKTIVYCPIPIPSGVYVKKREKVYDPYTPFRIIHFDGKVFELKKVGKGKHKTVLVSAQLVDFYVPSRGYLPFHYLTTTQLLEAMEV